ncbi:MAG: hypothetical protein COB03_02515 [Alteromonas sp.]|nr:MAG: hypothetical protein COB03_02515 [Alteromonas sp.]
MKKTLSFLLVSGLVSGCASNHHLVFFTNTTIGLEVGSEPNTGTPAKFVLGYKRQEGVIDPLIPDYEFHSYDGSDAIIEPTSGDTNIILTPAGVAAPKGSVTSPHSVLAKMNFGATGGGTGASAAQWFATGKAAELVAQSSGISGALSGDPENNVAPTIDLGKSKGDLAAYAYLDDVYKILDKSAVAGDKGSIEQKLKVDLIDSGLYKESFVSYSWGNPGKTELIVSPYDTKKDKNYFPNVIQYLATLSLSETVAEEAIIKQGVTISGSPITDVQKKALLEAAKSYPIKYKKGKESLSKSQPVIEMIDYVHTKVLLVESKNGEEGA